ncbi:MAG: hypothetical protein AAGL90_08110 [Pseudomonadota bacterium]
MIRRVTTAALSLSLLATALADAGAKDRSPEPPVRAQGEGSGLGAFVETAIEKGLLIPNEARAEAAPVSVAMVCSETYPLDFSVVRSLRRFTQLPDAEIPANDIEAEAMLIRDVRAKLALGLYSEARAMIAFAPDEDWGVFKKFIAMMEARERPDVAYFQALADCYPEAALWRAVAQLAVFDASGVDRIAAQIAAVRALPFNLREDVATLVIPSLLIERRADLAQQILATFTPEEIENATRLSALRTAILDMPNGSESDDRLVMLMSRPTLKLAALLILVERERQLRPTLHSFVLEEAWNVLEASETQHDLKPILDFVIRNLDSENLYSGLERVRALPVAARDDVREAVDTFTIQALDGYLADQDPRSSLSALQTLTVFHDDLPVNAYGTDLRKRGAQRALDLGLFSMVARFLAPIEPDAQMALMLAKAAFWGGQDQELFDVREAFPTEAEINRMAGIRALQANLPNIATAAFTGLKAYPSKQLELLEHGAAVDNWTLWSGDLAPLVAGLSDAEVQRLDRIRTIQVASVNPSANRTRTLRNYQITEVLNASRQALAPRAGAANE